MIIAISGPIHSGKTTIGKLLSVAIPNSVFVDCDYFLPPVPKTEENKQYIFSTLLERIRILQQHKRDTILAFPLREKDLVFLREKVSEPIICINLTPPIETVLAPRGSRILTESERTRVEIMYEQGYHQLEGSNIRLDNSELSPEKTVEIILKKLFKYRMS
ncbi:MAG: hypothetical protein PF904_15165 [Kiritimatiellae bacterium]|jgi:hypothetical protein|nr:hypothetical protein [Kiritimatiellia bacterium]